MGNRTKANDVASFGENLRQAREARHITLQEITATTKIGSRALQALEEDRFDQLPGGIFNKGFVRAYARCVGLNEEKTVAAYMVAAKVAAPETDMQALSSQVSVVREQRHESSMNAGAVVGVLAVIVALVLGGLWLKEHLKQIKEQAAQQRVESPVVSAPAPAVVPAVPIPIDPNASVAGSEVPGAPNSTPNSTLGASANSLPVAAPNTAPKDSAAPVEVSISATARAWISVRSDGKTVEQLVLDPDKPEMRSRTYKAQEKLMLIVGNPSGVSVIYNGKDPGALGKEGHRAQITFTPQGMERH